MFYLRRLARQRGLGLQYNFRGVERVANDDEGAAAHSAGDEALEAAVCVGFGFVGHCKRRGWLASGALRTTLYYYKNRLRS